MARKRKRRSGLGYGCPCVVKTKSRAVCATVPVRKGSRKYKTVCRLPNGKIVSATAAATRRDRGKRLGTRRAAQMRNLRRGRTSRRRRLRG